MYPPSIYIGESSRSLYERGKEHWRGHRTKAEDSHLYKHQELHHGGQTPNFPLRPIKFLNTALRRQIYEAVLIQRLGEEVVLNSKGEYNRCTVGRLTLNTEDRDNNKDGQRTKKEEEETNESEDKVKHWVQERTNDRRIQEIGQSINLERGLARSPARKRMGEFEDKHSTPSSGKKSKGRTKWKYPLLGMDWGSVKQPSPPTLTTTTQKDAPTLSSSPTPHPPPTPSQTQQKPS